MSKKNENNGQALETILFNCRNALRGAGGTEKNRDAVIGLVFLKFAGDKFEKRREDIKEQYGDVPAFLEKKSFYLAENVFYLQPHCRWSYIVKEANSNDIAVKIDTAMADVEKDNSPLQGALLSNFYTNLGVDVRTLKNLIDEINKIDEERFNEEDLIGRVYEYFLQSYAVASSKEDGEFYTPACVVELIAELIEPYSGTVYDPCCGSGGMFVQSVKFVERHHGNKLNVSIVGQEKNPDTRRLAKMNLAIRGISYDLGDKAIGESCTFLDDQHQDRKVDYIMANPPFNLRNWRSDNDLLTDARWSGYATPPKSNANYAWILHMLSKLDETNGVAGFLLSNGALNADGTEYEIRKKLIENDKVEAIIVLPRDMFYTTDISVSLWIVHNNKKSQVINNRKLRNRENEFLFIDLRTWDKNIEEYVVAKGRKKNKTVLTSEQIQSVKEIYNTWQIGQDYKNVPELCKSVNLTEIKENNYSLAPSKYIEFVDNDLNINHKEEMKRIQKEIKNILQYEKDSQNKLLEAFRGIGYELE